jgi:hypothetical protein
MEFVKRVVVWASIWTVVLVALLLVQDLRAGRPFDLTGTLLVTMIVWIVMAGLVTFWKIMSAARGVGRNLGRAVVHNPKQEAGAAIGAAVGDALQKAGVTTKGPQARS